MYFDLNRLDLVVHTTFFNGASFDPFTLDQDCLSASEVNVDKSEIVEASAVLAIIVMPDEGRDLGFKILLEELVFQQDAALERLVPTFDFPYDRASGNINGTEAKHRTRCY